MGGILIKVLKRFGAVKSGHEVFYQGGIQLVIGTPFQNFNGLFGRNRPLVGTMGRDGIVGIRNRDNS
jgi:hypothetical protein